MEVEVSKFEQPASIPCDILIGKKMMDWVIEIPQMYMCLDSKVWLVEIIGLKIGRKEQGFLSSISLQSARSNQVRSATLIQESDFHCSVG